MAELYCLERIAYFLGNINNILKIKKKIKVNDLFIYIFI